MDVFRRRDVGPNRGHAPPPRLASRAGAHLLSITVSKPPPPVTLGTSVVSSGLVSSVPPPPGLPVFCVGARLLRLAPVKALPPRMARVPCWTWHVPGRG